MEPSVTSTTLNNLRGNRWGKIVAVHGEGDQTARLHALGFLPGKKVRHRNTAPLGDPAAYELENQKVSLRSAEASLVEIELL